jgi:hypothetical protein
MSVGLVLCGFTVCYCTFVFLRSQTFILSHWFTTNTCSAPLLACSEPHLNCTASFCFVARVSCMLHVYSSQLQTLETRHTNFTFMSSHIHFLNPSRVNFLSDRPSCHASVDSLFLGDQHLHTTRIWVIRFFGAWSPVTVLMVAPVLTSHNFTAGHAAAFAAPSFRAWIRTSL